MSSVLFQRVAASRQTQFVDALGFLLIMNAMYCLEPVTKSSAQWGTVGEYFFLETVVIRLLSSTQVKDGCTLDVKTSRANVLVF